MWLQENEPETIGRTYQVMLPKDYVRLRLTGEAATDTSDAAATWLFDVVNQRWSDWLIGVCGVDARLLPPVLQSTTAAGWLTTEASNALKLPARLPVAAGCADVAAQALGCGLIDPGAALVVVGTGGQVLAPIREPASDPLMRSYLYNHAAPNRWYAQSATLAGGLGLRWLRDVLGDIDYAQLSALASATPPGAEGLLFTPHLAGKRPPARPLSRGGFTGLSLHHGRAHLARAVMEGIAFAMRECLEKVEVRAHAPLSPLIASGGAMESPVWRQIMADVLGVPIALMPGTSHACLGAAMLAGVSGGCFASLGEACSLLPPTASVIEPDSTAKDRYDDIYQQYCRISEWM